MRLGLWRLVALAGVLLVSSSALPVQAQTVSCTGVAAWSATTTYAVNAQVTYSGSLYKALVSTTNVAPNYCPTCGWWQVVGTCGTASCAAAPSVPTALTAPSKTSSSVNLSWTASTVGANCTASYIIYKAGTQVGTSTGTTATVSGLAANTSYSFTVAATDAFGSSAQSTALAVTTAAASCAAAPSVPTGLASPSKTSSSVNLSWTASSVGANCTASYIIYKGGTQVGTATGTTATVSGLAANTSYSFTVAATDAFGTSAQSTALAVTTAAATCGAAPSVPTGLASSAITASGCSLSWAAASAGSGCSVTYIVYKNGSQILTVPTTTANVTGLSASTAYSFTVASSDSVGNSAQSSAVSVTTSAASSTLTIAAASYAGMSGVIVETCSEGGQDVGSIDAGDWMYYPITIAQAGTYTVSYRVASIYSGKTLSADLNAGATQLGTVAIPNTGSWQTWQTVTQTVTLPAGTMNFGINGSTGGWNLEWFSITLAAATPVGPAGYTYCAAENGSYTFSQTVDVAYGANGAFNYKTGLTGTVTFNNATFGDPISGTAKAGFYKVSSASGLIALNSGAQMTFQFVNNTAGKYADNQIYVLMIARNSAGKFCYLDKNGTMNLCVSGQDASAYAVRMSDFAGFQFPTFLDSGRLYISLGAPLSIPINSDINGNVGIAFPNIENSADPNINTYFEWVEFAVINNAIWCNTTQVDQFGFPMVMELFTGTGSSYTSFGKVGMTESRAAIMSAYTASVPAEFQGLASTYRILAPIHGSFGSGKANGSYFDAYINSIWSKYTSSPLVITIPQGTFTGYVQSDSRLRFTRPSDGLSYYVAKPNSQAVWGGLGALASPSPETTGNGPAISIELALEAQICAAFHRHVMDTPADWNTPSKYYLAGPADFFSKFFHDHSINARAYGYCYDDVNDQSSTMTCGNPRGIILSIGF